MAVYNGEKYLAEAIESILRQTFRDFEFIIVDDGSTDRTFSILNRYAQEDNRIKILRNSTNIGPAASRNIGIGASAGRYLALMDADDICQAERLAIQADFLDRNQAVYIVGSWALKIDPFGNPLEPWCLPKHDGLIRWHILFRNSMIFCNPSVIMRRDIFRIAGLYNESILSYEDIDLWTRIFFHQDLKLTNITKVLVNYRVHEKSISSSAREEQSSGSREIRTKLLTDFLGYQVNRNAIAAYESGSVLEKAEIPGIVQTWLAAFRKFCPDFSVNFYDRLQIYREILTRIVGYVSIKGSDRTIRLAELKQALSFMDRCAVAITIIYSRTRNRHV